jgi:hypothetical protein
MEPRTTEMLSAQKLLDQYAALRDGAQAIGLKPPAGLTEAAAALHADADMLARLSLALDILNRGRALEQACTMQHATDVEKRCGELGRELADICRGA